MSLGTPIREMNGTANWSWAMYLGLSHGAVDTIDAHGSEEQKAIFLEPLISGRWTGTMCLTEPQAGSDVGASAATAEPLENGRYLIRGEKIFITSGEQDLTENIIHLVLARTPDAPVGTKGLSLFIIPKIWVNDDGSLGEPNDVYCNNIEHKMGIKGSATCTLYFGENGNCVGELLGSERQGLPIMFIMMNEERLNVGLQGQGIGSTAYLYALKFARERMQGQSLGGGKAGAEQVEAEHVERAVEARIQRCDRYRERLYQEIQRGTILIDTAGERVAQVNGLSVLQLADFRFGQPSRITATARLGEGEVVDIEREAEMGGPIHSKGVMILSACLAHRYARERPLSLSATLVFEQSYGMVEGDSASAAEFCALLSALGDIPLKQSLAITGSINQHGQIQAIGGNLRCIGTVPV